MSDLAEIWYGFAAILFTPILKIHGRIRSGHGVMASYMTSCSVEIGGFCDLSYLGELHCFLEWAFALHAALMMLRDI